MKSLSGWWARSDAEVCALNGVTITGAGGVGVEVGVARCAWLIECGGMQWCSAMGYGMRVCCVMWCVPWGACYVFLGTVKCAVGT